MNTSDRNKCISPTPLLVMAVAVLIGVCAWLWLSYPPEFKKNSEIVELPSVLP